jgi:hypothetical protein
LPEPVATFLFHEKTYNNSESVKAEMGTLLVRLTSLELKRRMREVERAAGPGALTLPVLRLLRTHRVVSRCLHRGAPDFSLNEPSVLVRTLVKNGFVRRVMRKYFRYRERNLREKVSLKVAWRRRLAG